MNELCDIKTDGKAQTQHEVGIWHSCPAAMDTELLQSSPGHYVSKPGHWHTLCMF